MKNFISVLLGLLILAGLSPVALGQFIYITNNGAITITKYTGTGGTVTIPSSINGLSVTAIGTNAFQSANLLVNVTIPGSVTNIGDQAFLNCFNLFAVSLGSGLLAIGNEAFYSCPGMNNITLPSSLVTIGNGAFNSCSLTGITIPSSVTSIGDSAFAFNRLSTFTLPANVTNLEGNPFSSCRSLAAISVSTNNPAFTNVGGILFNRSQTMLVAYPCGKAGGSYTVSNNVLAVGTNAFSGCTNLTNVIISASVTNIAGAPFGNCRNLTAITVDVGNPAYTDISGVLFDKSQSLLVQYPPGIATGPYAVPVGVASIGNAAFFNTHVTSVTLPVGVVSVGTFAFDNCALLTNVSLPAGITNLGDETFLFCSGIKSIVIPESLTSIGVNTFGATGLTNLIIPSGVTNIGAAAFEGCTSLVTVSLSSKVANLEVFSFYGCNKLTGAYFQGNAPSGDTTVFGADTKATAFYLPGTTGWSNTFGGIPTAIWAPAIVTSDGALGVQGNQFGFNIAWASNYTVTVSASTNLAGTNLSPVTNVVLTNGTYHFSEPVQGNGGGRYYRVSWP